MVQADQRRALSTSTRVCFQPDSSYLKRPRSQAYLFSSSNLNPRKLQSGQATQRQVVAHLAVWVAKNPTAHLFSSSNLNPRNLQSGQAAQHQAVSRLAARMNPTAFITASSSLPWASGRFKEKFQLPPFKPERVVEAESPTPYHMQTLICTTGALKTLCWEKLILDYIKSDVCSNMLSYQQCSQFFSWASHT